MFNVKSADKPISAASSVPFVLRPNASRTTTTTTTTGVFVPATPESPSDAGSSNESKEIRPAAPTVLFGKRNRSSLLEESAESDSSEDDSNEYHLRVVNAIMGAASSDEDEKGKSKKKPSNKKAKPASEVVKPVEEKRPDPVAPVEAGDEEKRVNAPVDVQFAVHINVLENALLSLKRLARNNKSSADFYEQYRKHRREADSDIVRVVFPNQHIIMEAVPFTLNPVETIMEFKPKVVTL